MAMRYTGLENDYAGFPILPQDTPVAVSGDVYPHSNVTRRTSGNDDAETYAYTWKFDGSQCWNRVFGIVVAGYVCVPALVDWTTVTRTFQRPRNPDGGIRRYTVTLWEATLTDGAADLFAEDVYEDRQPLLTAPNTFTEARKLPPEASGDEPSVQFNSYGTISPSLTVGTTYADASYRSIRHLGGGIFGNIYTGGSGATVDFWIVPIDSTSHEGDVASATLLGSVTEVSGIPTGYVFNAAAIEAAGAVRWEHYWLYLTSAGPLDPGSETTVIFSPPDDIPPMYDCPGETTYAPGGFYA